MEIFRELEFVDGRIVRFPCSIIYSNNVRFGPLALLAYPFFAIGTAAGASAATATTTGLILAGTAASAGGAIYGGMAAKTQAEAAAAMADYDAAVAKQTAAAIDKRSEFEQIRQTQEAARTMGTLAAGLSASGAVPSEGVGLLLQAKQASELELENLMIGYEGKIGVGRALSQAALDRMQAGIYRQRGRNIMTGSMIGAGGTLLTGFSQVGRGGGGLTSEGKATVLRY